MARIIDSHACFAPTARADTVLVLLNSGFACPAFLRALWGCASLHVAADGAAARLWRSLLRRPGATCACCGGGHGGDGRGGCGDVAGGGGASLSSALRANADAEHVLSAYVPDVICGDWDSIDSETEAFYASHGAQMIALPADQDSTDLEKCLRHVERVQDERVSARAADSNGGGACNGPPPLLRVIVYGAFGGRFDHEAQNLNCLYTWTSRFAAMVLLSEDSLVTLLPQGESSVRVAVPYEGPTCGLVPLGVPVEALTTRGLHWDVTDWPTRMGGRVSTSNRIEAYPDATASGGDPPLVVSVTSSAPILWTASVDSRAVCARSK